MDQVVAAALQSWTFDPWIIVPLVVAAGIYFRGWRELRRQMPDRFTAWRLVAFLSGLAIIFVAIASPLDAFAGLLLQVHMVQHILLMMMAPPLILLGAPAIPMLRGLPQSVAKTGLGPFLAWPALRRLGHFLAHPVVCWTSFVVANLAWHIPALYELALRSPFWHRVEHICFLGTALLFWWPVIQPWPSISRWPRWAMIPYLLLADLQNTALSAFIVFYERVIYPTYATVPRLWGISVLNDQAAAGSIMWVLGSVIFLVPVGWLIYQILSPSHAGRLEATPRPSVEPVTPQTFSQQAPSGTASGPIALSRLYKLLLLIPITAAILLVHIPTARAHHGGVVQFKEQAGPFIIAVFTEPTPLYAGPVEVSTMVQNRDNQRPILDADVTVLLQQRGGDAISAKATRQNASNKLMYTALVDLSAAGDWELRVLVKHGPASESVAGAVTAKAHRSPLLSFLPYLALFPLAIGLFGIHHWLSRRRGRNSGGGNFA